MGNGSRDALEPGGAQGFHFQRIRRRTYRVQGGDFRLTDVAGRVVNDIVA
ncbi:hypothetical protein [Rosistilla oblonga]